ncbi:MAG: Fic family protein [Corynebacterium casei]|uniref:Fido domain-containing protein n=1 Tax=Corynebacterium casei UCMA 3821 TaxID=1110505 RepID=G7HWD0_9CORY|nr:Fic family protein [Corynebacterium casei]MDN5800730.1 Fic family protein [Corynebacterium casei]MDN5826345.1 Fic family protein [Corynebacterium casei]MDN5885125.1 Fic family protein [Corynebacterium casei]MDN5903826.1 Fic family protein [Corynebacterium casei]MDN5922434.1 Fic family protein [Corynebacterium casei]
MQASGYKQMKINYHQAGTNARSLLEEELNLRISSPSSLHWNYTVNGHPVFVNLVAELTAEIEKIWRTEFQIQKLWNLLPGVARNHYLHSLLISEIQSTNEIEGIHSTRNEIEDAIRAAESKDSANLSFRPFQEMAKTYLLLFGELDNERVRFPATLKEMRELYDQLMGKEIAADDKLDGLYFRKGTVSITDGTKEIHRGLSGEDAIHSGVLTMLNAQQDSEHVLVNAFVGHFLLEHIHPFYDGNGRFGRFLLGLKLTEYLSAPTAISLSAAVLHQKARYYKAFSIAEEKLNRGELTFFVHDLAEILASAMLDLLESLTEKVSQLEQLSKGIDRYKSNRDSNGASLQDREDEILFLLGQVRLFGPRSGMTNDELSAVTGLSKKVLRPRTLKLREAGLIREVEKRPLVFALTDEAIELLGISD